MLLLLSAYNYRTIDHCVKLCRHEIVLNDDDYDCEENGSEKKSEDKTEKKEFLDYALSEKTQPSLGLSDSQFYIHYALLFLSTDHSKAVYSPPDKVAV